jgi:hypothetical protein
MNEEEVNAVANELVEELIVFNKIKMNVKNIWATKLIDFFLSEKQDYNLFQHSKVMKKIPKIPADGIQALLELIRQQDNQMETKLLTTHTDVQIDYSGIWNKSNEKAKECFYDTFNSKEIPSSTKWISREYFKELGWTQKQITKVIGDPW